MRKKKNFIGFLLLAVLIFTYGVFAVHFRFFPFYQLKMLKMELFPAHDANYAKTLQKFAACHDCSARVVMLGDSLTAQADWATLLPGAKTANRGIPGDDSFGVLHRLDGVFRSGASLVFIMLGINDFYHEADVSDVLENYREIVRALRQKNIRVVIQSTLYVHREDIRLVPKIEALNKALATIAAHDAGVEFVDLNARLAHEHVLKPQYTRDGIHLNTTGYHVWACTLLHRGLLPPATNAAMAANCGNVR